SRESVRKYEDRPVEREKILTCIEAARLAPSAENVQPWRFAVLDDPEVIKNFSEKVFSGLYRYTRWASKAPVIVAIFAEKDWLANRIGKEIQGTHYYLIDSGIAGEHLVLQAEQLGLGSCWIGWFNAKNARIFLGVPRGWQAVSLLALGYPLYKRKEKRPKKNIEEILFFNHYNLKK
ncbi:MAG: nitroreductase family protein, partial [bacterium]